MLSRLALAANTRLGPHYGALMRGVSAYGAAELAIRVVRLATTVVIARRLAPAIVGEAAEVVYPGVHPAYRAAVLRWQERAKALRRDLGYVAGTVVHHWHGRKVDRQYWTRKRVLVESQFNPDTDLARDSQGLWRLVDDGSDRFITLRDGLRAYFRARHEDSIDA